MENQKSETQKEERQEREPERKGLTRLPVVCLLAMVCCILWGSAFPCIKIGYQLFQIKAGDIASQILFAGIRFAMAGVLVILFGSIQKKGLLKPAGASLPMVFHLALLQTVAQYVLFYIGLANTTGVKGSIIGATVVFFSILVASLLFHYEELSAEKTLGCLVGFAGVVVINLAGGSVDAGISLKGEGFLLLSTLASALSSVYIKKYSEKENPVTLSGYQFFTGGILLAVCGTAMGGHIWAVKETAYLLLLYLALISAVAYTLWGILLKYNPVSRVAVFGFMNPLFGVIFSAVLLNEKNQAFSAFGLASLALVSSGIYLVNKAPKKGKNG